MFLIYDCDFVSANCFPINEAGSMLSALERAYAELWRWHDILEFDAIKIFPCNGIIRLVPVTDGEFWDNGVCIIPV